MDPSTLLEHLEQSTSALQELLVKVPSDVQFNDDGSEEELLQLTLILEQRGQLVTSLIELLNTTEGEMHSKIAHALYDTTLNDHKLIELALTKKEYVRKVIVKMNKAPTSISQYTKHK